MGPPCDCDSQEAEEGKADGPEDLSAKHLHYAHPALLGLTYLKVIFKLILCHCFVPNSFGIGIIVPCQR